MRSLILSALCSLLSAACLGQTTTVLKDKNNRLIDSLKVPSGKTFTIESGATINATGATITGFTTSTAWADITGKPTEFTPAAHNQAISTITGLQTALDAKASTASLSSYLTTANAASTYQPLSSLLTAISNLPHSPGVLANDGAGSFSYTSTTTDVIDLVADAGKLIRLGTGQPILQINNGLFKMVDGGVLLENGGLDISTPGVGNTAKLFPGLVQLTDPTDNAGMGNSYSNWEWDCWEWWPVGQPGHGALMWAPLTADRTLTLPDATGTLISTGDTGTVTNAMLAGSIALSKLSITGTPDGTKYLRDDGSWQTVTSGATLAANTFTGLQQFSGTTHAGLRLNNLTTTQRDALTGAAGMVIWNTTAGRMQLHNGSAWTAGMVRLDGDTMTGTLTITPASNTSALAVTGYSLTGSSTTALATLAGTWNTTGIAEGILLNITNTASNASSRLLRLQVGSVDRFAVAPTGGVTLRHSSSANDFITIGGTSNMVMTAQSNSGGIHYQLVADTTGGGGPASFRFGAGALLEWNSVSSLASGSRDLKIGRDSAAILQLGEDHATTATNQALKGHDVTTGTGASLDLRGGNGSTAGGSVTISTSATTTPTVRMTIKASGVINMSGMPTSSAGLSSGDLWNDAGTVKIVP